MAGLSSVVGAKNSLNASILSSFAISQEPSVFLPYLFSRTLSFKAGILKNSMEQAPFICYSLAFILFLINFIII